MSERKRPKGVLAVIIGLLIASATLRIGMGANAALAVDIPPLPEGAGAAMALCTEHDTPATLLAALQEREELVSQRETQLENRMQALRVAESEIDEKLRALADAETVLSDLIALADTAAEDDLGRLTLVYENMKPADAAALFEEMDPEFSAGFMGRMQPEAAALIMSNLEPETAHIISVILASRNAGLPDD